MKRIIFIYVICLFGCGTLMKDKNNSKTVDHLRLMNMSNERVVSHGSTIVKDSSDATVNLIIWPKGEFVFNPVNGFKGEAVKMEWKGKQAHFTQSSTQSTSKRKATMQQELQKEQVAKLKEKTVESKAKNYGFGFLFLLLVIILIWYNKNWLTNWF